MSLFGWRRLERCPLGKSLSLVFHWRFLSLSGVLLPPGDSWVVLVCAAMTACKMVVIWLMSSDGGGVIIAGGTWAP